MAVPTLHVKPEDLTPEIVAQYVSYNPDTGLFTWVKSRSTGKAVDGDKAGTWRGRYWAIQVLGHRYRAHRLAWFVTYGEWPTKFLDHINGNTKDNRIANLREATSAQNNANRRPYEGKLKGTYKLRNRWVAQIKVNGKSTHIGSFATAEEAHAAYVLAAKRIHGEFARY